MFGREESLPRFVQFFIFDVFKYSIWYRVSWAILQVLLTFVKYGDYKQKNAEVTLICRLVACIKTITFKPYNMQLSTNSGLKGFKFLIWFSQNALGRKWKAHAVRNSFCSSYYVKLAALHSSSESVLSLKSQSS